MRSVPLCVIITAEAGGSEGERERAGLNGGGGEDEITPVLVAD